MSAVKTWMRRVLAVLPTAVAALVLSADSSHGQATSMFSDPRASDLGDALTVIIQESATATNRTSTVLEKENTVEIASTIPGLGNVLDFVPLHTLDSEFTSEYEGTGSTSRSAQLNARITVAVVGKKPNGDLIIDGVRSLKINGETEAIHLSGTVSLANIRSDNTILSSNIGDLNIEYTGKGTITQGSRPGIFVRLVNWLF